MLDFMQLIKQVHPGIFIHSVYIDKDLGEDKKAGFVRQCHFKLKEPVLYSFHCVVVSMGMSMINWNLLPNNSLLFLNCRTDSTQ